MKWPKIIEVEDAPLPAVVYEQDGELVVEVDAKLKGRRRAAAVVAAVRSYKRGFGSVVVLPVALYAWEPIKNGTRNHPGTALGVTAVGSGLIALAIALPDARNDGNPPPGAAPQRTLTATITASSAPPSSTRSPSEPRQDSSTTRPGAPDGTASTPAPLGREAAKPNAQPSRRDPTTRPTRTRQPKPVTSSQGEGAEPAGSITALETNPTTGAASTPAAVASTQAAGGADVEAPAVEAPPGPTPSLGNRCLVRVDLNPLLDVCVR